MPLSCHFYLDLFLPRLRMISQISSPIITSILSMTWILVVGFMPHRFMCWILIPCDCGGDWPRYDKTKQLLQLKRGDITAINDGMSCATWAVCTYLPYIFRFPSVSDEFLEFCSAIGCVREIKFVSDFNSDIIYKLKAGQNYHHIQYTLIK